MSDKILVPDNRLMAISNNNDVTMTSFNIEIAAILDPPSWIPHFEFP